MANFCILMIYRMDAWWIGGFQDVGCSYAKIIYMRGRYTYELYVYAKNDRKTA